MELALLFVGSALVNNFILARFLGTCPFLGVTKKLDTAVRMGLAVTFVLVWSGTMTWALDRFVLVPLHLTFLRYVAFILVIAVSVQFLEMLIHKTNQSLYEAFGIYLALITTNCAVLGLAILVTAPEYTFAKTVVFALGGGLGFTLAMAMMAGIREQLETAEVPPSLQGSAMALLIAGVMAMAFMGFSGLVAI